MKNKLPFLIIVMITSISIVRASETQVDGIWYDFNSSNKTASVTYHGSFPNEYLYDEKYSGSIKIPATVAYDGIIYTVTSIGKDAFSICTKLTSVTIPNTVTRIEDDAFNRSGLTSITIPNSVKSIGNYAFSGCYKLISVTIGNSVTTIGEYAFSGCEKLTSVKIPNGVTSIRSYTFNECSSLNSATIPNSVTTIGERAFCYCKSLISVTIPNSVTSIGYAAFDNCRCLTSITIPYSVTSIGYDAFSSCYELTIKVPARFYKDKSKFANSSGTKVITY